ncbi:MAG: DegT/DnrJ/EryC1/StrS family aminotransferase [Patescibacteria group bacterium]
MLVFNSLGSNYSANFCWLAFSSIFHAKDLRPMLTNRLATQFNGEVELFLKGRDAIEYSLMALGIGRGDEVITQAFCCSSIEEAVNRVGAKIQYADLLPGKTYPSLDSLELARQKSSNPKAVILQNLFGYRADDKAIRAWVKKNNLLLIDDLAQSWAAKSGSISEDNADALILSFGRDKIVDAVSGGAAVVKNKKQQVSLSAKAANFVVVRDLLYPILTWMIRRTYSLQLGKALHFLAKKTGLMTNPIMSVVKNMSPLPKQYSTLVLKRLETLEDEILHRREIAMIYYHGLKDLSAVRVVHDLTEIENGVNLRFIITCHQPQSLISFLSKKNIYISDRWYRKAIDCGSIDCPTSYSSGSCPNAEMMAQTVINLPTHGEVSHQHAIRIVNEIINWSENYGN